MRLPCFVIHGLHDACRYKSMMGWLGAANVLETAESNLDVVLHPFDSDNGTGHFVCENTLACTAWFVRTLITFVFMRAFVL